MEDKILVDIFVFLAAACIAVPLSSRLKLGSVLGYILAGILIGPFGLSLITDVASISHFAEFGIVMMLFLIGLELEPSILWRLRKAIIGLGGLQVIVTSLAFTSIGIAFGYEWKISMAVGMALSLSSTAIALQVLQEKKLMQTTMGESSFAVLLFQDIAVIPILVILPLLAVTAPAISTSPEWLNRFPDWVHALIIVGIICLMVMAGRFLSRPFFHIIAKTNLREVFTATSLAVVIGVTLLMKMLGVSPALGAFIAGVVLANSEYRHTIETDIQPFKGLLLGLFFISVGMGIDFGLLLQMPLLLLGITVLLMVVKGIVLFGLGKLFGLTPQHNSGFVVVLAQGGEFAFVLFQFIGGLSLLPPQDLDFLNLVVALSMLATPFMMGFYSKFIIPRFMSVLPETVYDSFHDKSQIIIAGFGRFGQVISRFLLGQGIKVTVLEKDADQIEQLRKFGFKGYFGDAARLDILRSAGIADAKVLIIAVDDIGSCMDIAKIVKEEFPHVTIFARARNRRHAYDLHKIGVTYFKREVFDSALNMAKDIMVFLGKDEEEMHAKSTLFKKHDFSTLKKSFAFFDDEAKLILFARQRSKELEDILQQDMNQDKPS